MCVCLSGGEDGGIFFFFVVVVVVGCCCCCFVVVVFFLGGGGALVLKTKQPRCDRTCTDTYMKIKRGKRLPSGEGAFYWFETLADPISSRLARAGFRSISKDTRRIDRRMGTFKRNLYITR